MYEIFEKVGLPVTCRKCGHKGFARLQDHNGWYRSKWGPRLKRWLCPEHAEAGRTSDKYFTDRFKTPERDVSQADITTEELYKLLD